MKNRRGMQSALVPLVVTISTYTIFYSRIESKPNHPGFWFILALGMSIGVVLIQFIQWIKSGKNEPGK